MVGTKKGPVHLLISSSYTDLPCGAIDFVGLIPAVRYFIQTDHHTRVSVTKIVGEKNSKIEYVAGIVVVEMPCSSQLELNENEQITDNCCKSLENEIK